VIHVLPISEREPFFIERFVGFAQETKRKGVEALAGLVDEDGDVTFYSIRTMDPEGNCHDYGMGGILRGKFGQNRVLVPLDGNAKLLHKEGFFGRVVGTTLHLSLIEAGYLLETSRLRIEGLDVPDFTDRAGTAQADFSLRYPAYSLLRKKGMRVKTGFKYGTHFRAYSSDPDSSHADLLVHVFPDGARLDWQEISRGIRVAHGVNKRIIFTSPGSVEKDEFLELAWVRP